MMKKTPAQIWDALDRGLLFNMQTALRNYDDWPFLWGQNEGTIAGNTQYIIFGSI